MKLLDLAKFNQVVKRWNKYNIRVLSYHSIGTGTQDVLSATAESFDLQMKYLKDNYNVLTPKQFLSGKINENSVLLTFDDGYRDNYDIVFPILKKYGFKAIFFVTTGHIGKSKLFWWDEVDHLIAKYKNTKVEISGFDTIVLNSKFIKKLKMITQKQRNSIITIIKKKLEYNSAKISRQFMNWQEIRAMSKLGMYFGSHTVTHPILSRESNTQVEKEIVDSNKVIESHLSYLPEMFCYPNGQKGDYGPFVIDILEKNGIRFAFTTIPGMFKYQKKDFSINRICVHSKMDKYEFACELSGLKSMVRRWM